MWSLEGSLAEDYCRLEADWLARRHTEKPLDDAGGGNLTIVTIYVNTPAGTLQKFDAVYHGALRFNTALSQAGGGQTNVSFPGGR
ncbi:hypothetical protein ILYODFUR_022396 [Ilyodon furcidens]|uniref:Uncharacterized protein n=1 Tax=Ilyodon furcidens TaxID=33524 RepID=A0ABV0TWS9_9TELE